MPGETNLPLGKVVFGPASTRRDLEERARGLFSKARERKRQEIAAEEREECAALAEAAGCLCEVFRDAGLLPRDRPAHHAKCPKSLAAAIRARGAA